MAKVAVISAEGVLVQQDLPDRSFLTFTPLAEGLALMQALSTGYHVVVVTERAARAELLEWLDLHGLTPFYSAVVVRQSDEAEYDAVALAEAQLALLRGRGHTVAMWVGADPDVAAAVIAKGVTALVFAHPTYGRFEWHPDIETGLRPWDSLTSEVERQRLARAADERLHGNPEDVLDGRWEAERR